MTSPIWTIEPHTTADKYFRILPPEKVQKTVDKYSGFTLSVDYDDVDHKAVDDLVGRIVKILNNNLDNL